MTRAALATCAALAVLCAGVVGCGEHREPASVYSAETPQPPSQADGLTSQQSRASAADCLALWEAGKHDEALAVFVAVDWANVPRETRPSILQLSDTEYSQSTGVDRARYDAAIDGLDGTVRALARAFNESAKSKDASSAERDYRVLLAFGAWLSDDRTNLQIMRAVGQGVKRAALNGLVDVYTRLGNQAQLDATKEELSGL